MAGFTAKFLAAKDDPHPQALSDCGLLTCTSTTPHTYTYTHSRTNSLQYYQSNFKSWIWREGHRECRIRDNRIWHPNHCEGCAGQVLLVVHGGPPQQLQTVAVHHHGRAVPLKHAAHTQHTKTHIIDHGGAAIPAQQTGGNMAMTMTQPHRGKGKEPNCATGREWARRRTCPRRLSPPSARPPSGRCTWSQSILHPPRTRAAADYPCLPSDATLGSAVQRRRRRLHMDNMQWATLNAQRDTLI